jgi:hypothetical protein
MGLQEVHAVQLSLQEEEDVMCAVGRVLSTVTSSIDVNSALERLLKPTHAAMETLVGDFSSLVEVVLHCISCQSGPSFDHLCLSLSHVPTVGLMCSLKQIVKVLSDFIQQHMQLL